MATKPKPIPGTYRCDTPSLFVQVSEDQIFELVVCAAVGQAAIANHPT